jgi:predicted MFS family arabinose efflux permease
MVTNPGGRTPLKAGEQHSSVAKRALESGAARLGSIGGRLDRSLERRLGGPARKRTILILASVLALNGANSGAIGAMAVQLERSLHIDNTGLGFLVTASSIAGAVISIPVGILADRFNRRWLLLAGLTVWTVACGASAFAESLASLVLFQLVVGAAAAVAGPSVASLTGDFFSAGERGTIYGFILTGELVGAGFGIVVAGDLGAAIGWRAGLFLLCLAGAGLTGLVFRFLAEPVRGGSERLPVTSDSPDAGTEVGSAAESPPAPTSDVSLVQAIKRKGFVAARRERPEQHPERLGIVAATRYILRVRTNVLLILASSIGYFFFAGVRTFAVLFISRRFGLPQAVTTLLVPLVGVGAIAGILGAGRISDHLIRRGRVDARIIVAALGYLAAVVLFLPALLTTSLAIGLPLVIVAGAAIGAPNAPLDAARLDVMPFRLWGRAEAVRTAIRTLLESAAPLLFGYLSVELGGAPTSISSNVNPSGAHTHQVALSNTHAEGLQRAFLIMLVPLALSGILVWKTRRHYPGDVLAAAEVDGTH